MALTVRLPDELQIEANCYAAGLGLSLNSLIAVALREYLDDRKRPQEPAPASLPPAVPAGRRRAAPTPPAPPAPPVDRSRQQGAWFSDVLDEVKRGRP